MKVPTLSKNVATLLSISLTIFASRAHAAIDNSGLLDNVVDKYKLAASAWAVVITNAASWLFWTLAIISMVWTFGFMAFRKADIGEFFAEFIRFTIFTGFFWWLLTNGPKFATSIIDSLKKLGGQATGLGGLSPSGIVDIGFKIFGKVIDQSSLWSPVDSGVGIIIGAVILIILALISINMVLLLVSGWILAYGGIFFLGFGGSRWTTDIAINYYKTVLGVAASLMTMILLVGIGKTFLDDYYTHMSAGITLKEMGVMLVVAAVLLTLTDKVPSLVSGIITGASVGGTGAVGNFGAGAAMGAASMATMAAGMAGTAATGGLTSMAGGASAIKAAYDTAQANIRGDGGGAMPSFGGSGVSPFATAMGDSGSGSLGLSRGSNSGWGSATNAANDSGGFSAPPSTSNSTESNSGASAGSDTKGNAQDGAIAAKAGKGSTSTIANLTQGAMDVAKAALGQRIGETTGGKIAAAIKSSGQGAETNTSSTFNNNSLSAGTSEPFDPESEIAAFRDRTS
jgi:type IV secretion system protein TrbL